MAPRFETQRVSISRNLLLGIIFSSLLSACLIMVLGNKLSVSGVPTRLVRLSRQNLPDLPDVLRNVKTITCIGDSITRANGLAGGYVEIVASYLNSLYPDHRFVVINRGVDGDTSDDVVARFEKDALSNGSDLIVVMVGINDLADAVEKLNTDAAHESMLLAKYKANLEKMIKQSKKTGKRIIVMSPVVATERPDFRANQILRRFVAAGADAASENEVPYVDLNAVFISIVRDYRKQTGAADLILTVDGVHPSGLGHRVIANCLLNSLGITTEQRQKVQPQL